MATGEEKEELERKYKAARSCVALSTETLNLFGYMSDGCQELMCDETLVERIAQMANYFLKLLVGKERHTLRVRNMGRLNFYPTKMVVSLAELYISLGERESWQGAVVR